MLILESHKPPVKRISAEKLREEMKLLHDECNKDKDYCLAPCPRETTHRPRRPVEACLNESARKKFDANKDNERLTPFSGEIRTAEPRGALPGVVPGNEDRSRLQVPNQKQG